MQNKRNVIKKSVIFSLIALFIYGVWWLFSPLASEYLRMKTTKAMTGRVYHLKDVYYFDVKTVVFVDGNFLLFVGKPYLFKPLYGYAFISKDGETWIEVPKSKTGAIFKQKSVGLWTPNNSVPMEFNQKCFIFGDKDHGKYSEDCKTSWVDFYTVWENSYEESRETNYWGTSSFYTQPLHYNNKLVFVFKSTKNILTTQLIPDYAVLYATDNGIYWHKIDVTESVIHDLIIENDLKLSPLKESIEYAPSSIHLAYDLPKYPLSNLNAYNVLNNINQKHHLGLTLDPARSAYGNGVYFAAATKANMYDNYFITSRDGESYQLVKPPKEVTNFAASMFF
jgi:hypothetical protein